MTYEKILETTKKAMAKCDVSNMEGHLAIQVDIVGEGEGAFYVELKDKQLFVEPYEYFDRDCKFIVNADDFTKIIAGKLDAAEAYAQGALRIDGNADKLAQFKDILASVKKTAKKPATKKTTTAKKPAAKKTETAKAATAKKTETKAAPKKAEAKTATAKKPAAKKTETAKATAEKKTETKAATAKKTETKATTAKKPATKKTK